jgi:hypothetical protein
MGENFMRIQLTRLFLVPVTTLFCTMAFATTLPDTGQALTSDNPGGTSVFSTGSEPVMQAPLLLAKKEKVDVCHFLPNGKYITQNIPLDTYEKLHAEHPHEWLLGTCEEVISPHTFYLPAEDAVKTM